MTQIVARQQCRSLDGWYPYKAQSSADEDAHYVVHVNPWANRSEQHVCECKGYQYRGRCRHQKEAHLDHCGWNEVDSEIQQTPEEAKNRICPECGGPTHYAMWEVDE
ncbi:MAG TPA: hypothetical protein VIJ87_01055 [Pyrinomonadaceae bacterium]